MGQGSRFGIHLLLNGVCMHFDSMDKGANISEIQKDEKCSQFFRL